MGARVLDLKNAIFREGVLSRFGSGITDSIEEGFFFLRRSKDTKSECDVALLKRLSFAESPHCCNSLIHIQK